MPAHTLIDLNSDVGERPDALDQDAEILRSVTSANVACGFHAGNAETMRATCALAKELGVTIGAHVSYRDRVGFGRRDMNVAPERLAGQVTEQIAALAEIAVAAGAAISYVKPHGALYNRCIHDQVQADAVIRGIATFDKRLLVLGLPGSALTRAAHDHGLRAEAEGYADRAYLASGALAPRNTAGAVLELEQAIAQALALAANDTLVAVDGTELQLRVSSLCVHSDTPGAPVLARALRASLVQAGIHVRPFA